MAVRSSVRMAQESIWRAQAAEAAEAAELRETEEFKTAQVLEQDCVCAIDCLRLLIKGSYTGECGCNLTTW